MYRLTLLTPLFQTFVLHRSVLQSEIGQFEVYQPLPPFRRRTTAIRVVRVPECTEEVRCRQSRVTLQSGVNVVGRTRGLRALD